MASFHLYIRHAVKVVGWMGVCIDRYIQKMLMLQAVQEMMRIRCQSSGQVAVSQSVFPLPGRSSVSPSSIEKIIDSQTHTHKKRALGSFLVTTNAVPYPILNWMARRRTAQRYDDNDITYNTQLEAQHRRRGY